MAAVSSQQGRSDPGDRRHSVDAIDLAMLRALRDDGRMTVTQLAREVNVSRANAYTRLERLSSQGVIEGFGVRVEPRAVGLEVAALILLTAEQGRWRQLMAKLLEFPEIEFVGITTGDFDVAVLVRTTTTDALRDVVLERFHALPEIRSSRTVLLLDDFTRGPVLPEGEP
jgi:DNA-binding Lrp family transcriptional regulator